MATSKKLPKDYKAYFFMSIDSKDGAHIVYEDGDNQAMFAAGFASVMANDPEFFDTISTALLALLEEKEKYNSKKSNIVPKTVKKSANKK